MPAENEPGGLIEITPDMTFETADAHVQLRFVERVIPNGVDQRSVRILQQAWAITTYRCDRLAPEPTGTRIEWRDVPLVAE